MKAYWMLALLKHREAEMPLRSFRDITRWIDHLMTASTIQERHRVVRPLTRYGTEICA